MARKIKRDQRSRIIYIKENTLVLKSHEKKECSSAYKINREN